MEIGHAVFQIAIVRFHLDSTGHDTIVIIDHIAIAHPSYKTSAFICQSTFWVSVVFDLTIENAVLKIEDTMLVLSYKSAVCAIEWFVFINGYDVFAIDSYAAYAVDDVGLFHHQSLCLYKLQYRRQIYGRC